MSKRIGFTTSFPVEVVYAAGMQPIDLNNIFITGSAADAVYQAELKGFPRTICAWIKGNYQAARTASLDEVIGVVQGDCANSQSLLSVLSEEGLPIYHFSYPINKSRDEMERELSRLEDHFGVTRRQTLEQKERLDRIRTKLVELDRMTWEDGLISGKENHLWLVNASDFQTDPSSYELRLDRFLEEASRRDPFKPKLRLAYLGVPPIFSDLYDTLRSLGVDIVFNEIQRQFAMPSLVPDIVDQYLQYTYPYSVFERLADINAEVKRRKIDAIISYTQSFCHMQIDNILLKKNLDLPFLTLEGDQPEAIDSRTLLRLESFVEVHG